MDSEDAPDGLGFLIVLLGVIALCVFMPEPTKDAHPHNPPRYRSAP